ncbi:protein mono-ADP-ribosyltransferase PARP11-like [Hyalella azteca]|uniref:Poly [ADP-ribose] polymerase n=1 Tax=Hyalella azteca TaxID=294128 RepID=A0A8B7NQN7_HYAAZ|nr:protein mono-ADP-ribosyltransferase PARP11-like [Hyalella azteca]
MGYKWQFKDEHGKWIDYGKVSSGNIQACTVTASSEAIERAFAKNPKARLLIKSPAHQYRLDFNTMKQTNLRTQVTRDVRRVVDNSSTNVSLFNQARRVADNASTNVSLFNQASINTIMGITTSFLKTLIEDEPPQIPNGQKCSTVSIAPNHVDYAKVLAFLKPTLPNCNPKSIFKINNPYLKTAFENKTAQLQSQYPTVQYRVHGLFHGTSSKNIQAIAEENIDWRLHGSCIGQKYGRGAYFSNQASESRLYGDTIFICNVLVGLTTTGDSNTIKPPKDGSNRLIDTTVNDTANPRIFVKYDSQEYFPVYYALF